MPVNSRIIHFSPSQNHPFVPLFRRKLLKDIADNKEKRGEQILNVDTSFIMRRRERQIRFERSVLRELSLEKLKKGFQIYFGPLFIHGRFLLGNAIEEGCYDVAVEAYLSGSRYSRLSYYGEPLESLKSKSFSERRSLAKTLEEFILYWGNMYEEGKYNEAIPACCENFVDYWWEEGLIKGKIKYKMKIH